MTPDELEKRIDAELMSAMPMSTAEVLHESRVEIRRLRDQLRWRRFGDERPEVGAVVIVLAYDRKVPRSAKMTPDFELWGSNGDAWDTHPDDRWQPIPEISE